jgi:site-specific DNA-methyltransferase (adenine-specific)
MHRKPGGALDHRCIHVFKESIGKYSISSEPEVPTDSIIHGDAAKVLTALPNSCVQAIITSPPYYQQRDYDAPDQLGCESSPAEYVARLVAIMRECKRLLREDGLLWLNLGDKYLGGRLLGMPWRVALALSDSGWFLRSDIIWHKLNAMPSSVKNRPTTDHEYIFMLSRSQKYYYDADSIREPHITFSENSKMKGGRGHFGKVNGTPELGKFSGSQNLHNGRWDQAFHPLGRNKRTVWPIPLSKNPDAHFAVFPEKLVETCLMASTRYGDTILDPFCGSGTSLAMARRLGRHFIGIDINKNYCEMATRRVKAIQAQLPLAPQTQSINENQG